MPKREKILLVLLAFGIVVPYYKIIGTLSIPNLLLLLSSFTIISSKTYSINKKLLNYCLFYLFLFIVAILRQYNLEDGIKVYIWPLIILFGTFYALSNPKAFFYFNDWFVSIMALSCLVAFFQSLDVSIFWDIRNMFGIPEDEVLLEQFYNRSKVPGLSYYGVQLGYQISFTFPLFLMRLYFNNKNIYRKLFNYILFICFILGAISLESIATFFTIFASIVIYLYYSKKKTNSIFLILLFFGIVFSFLNINQSNRVLNISNDASAMSRLGLFYMGASIAIEHPFGLNNEALKKEKLKFIYSKGLSTYFIKIPFHNSFINIAAKEGLFIMFLYILIFYLLFKKMKKSWTLYFSETSKLNVAFFLRLSLFSYLVQTMVHNAGLPSSDLFGWFIVGLIISFVNFDKSMNSVSTNYRMIARRASVG